MNDTLVRLVYVIWFISFMATCYLGLHVLVAPLLRPDSKTGAFFTILTSPLTRPIRRLLGPGASEKRVRSLSLAAVAAICVVFRMLLASALPAPGPR